MRTFLPDNLRGGYYTILHVDYCLFKGISISGGWAVVYGTKEDLFKNGQREMLRKGKFIRLISWLSQSSVSRMDRGFRYR